MDIPKISATPLFSFAFVIEILEGSRSAV